MRSGLRGEEMPKEPAPVLTNPYDHTDSCILILRYASIYIGVTDTPPSSLSLLTSPPPKYLHRCGSTKHPLLASLGASDPSKYRPSLTSIELERIRHEEKDVAYMPYGNETWTTEFMGVAMETG